MVMVTGQLVMVGAEWIVVVVLRVRVGLVAVVRLDKGSGVIGGGRGSCCGGIGTWAIQRGQIVMARQGAETGAILVISASSATDSRLHGARRRGSGNLRLLTVNLTRVHQRRGRRVLVVVVRGLLMVVLLGALAKSHRGVGDETVDKLLALYLLDYVLVVVVAQGSG